MSKKYIIHLVAAARPNFMKIAPLYHALVKEPWCLPLIIHTGQHYDANMSDAFFRDLNLPDPDIHLGVGSGTHAMQTAGVMIEYEKVCLEKRPDMLIVVGDVNSTMACAITAKKLCIPVSHLEAGLRSRDRTMPEEINRIVTDSISDLLLTPSPDADENLINEGISKSSIIRVGNIMIDSYEMLREKIVSRGITKEFGLSDKEFSVVTFHRPVNVDDADSLSSIVDVLQKISRRIKIVFPVHPRTRQRLIEFDLLGRLQFADGIILTEPLGYIDFMSLVVNSKIVITDSGGIQEETTYLGIPCFTIRETTERPVTITQGTNKLVSIDNVLEHVDSILNQGDIHSERPDLWDGFTAGRVVVALRDYLNNTFNN